MEYYKFSKSELKELLGKAFESGMYSYGDLKDSYVNALIGECKPMPELHTSHVVNPGVGWSITDLEYALPEPPPYLVDPLFDKLEYIEYGDVIPNPRQGTTLNKVVQAVKPPRLNRQTYSIENEGYRWQPMNYQGDGI